MKNPSLFYLLLIFFCLVTSCIRPTPDPQYVISRQSSDFAIYIDTHSDELIQWAANELAKGIGNILEKDITVSRIDKYSTENKGIYIGQSGDHNLPKDFATPFQEAWEHFFIKKQKDNLLIVGSDVRGTVYGVFELAEQMGISPWIWWADVQPEKKKEITLDIPAEGISEGPSVQYRGIFLNDEDWGLQPWAAHTFEPETGDIGPKTYEQIFQLLLRLKANTIWPAMHPSTKAFFKIPGNKEMAEKYQIFIGTSHAEPMLRNNVDEWEEEQYGEYNYFTNSTAVKNYWQERITEANNANSMVTLGMRGIHDSGMQGDFSTADKVQMLETIITDQREILSKTFDKPISKIPQVFIPYKEVLYLYDAGLKVPEDITLMWTDDNYGYIRRLSNEAEQKREGGSGVYYHLSYWGRPHDYLWLSTTQSGLIWYEMTRAYQNGAPKIWIANVGDIKPAEYNMEFFLDLAWDVQSIRESTIKDHLQDWCEREFGEAVAVDIADLKSEYYRLALLRKPEYMGWSTTEPTTPTRATAFTTANGNELQRRIDAYEALGSKTVELKAKISAEKQDAYFQLVEYPVRCAALMNHKFLYAQLSLQASAGADKETFAIKSQKAFDEIVALTQKYNTEMANGKWNKMMSMSPRSLPVFDMPTYHTSNPAAAQSDTTPAPQNSTLSPVFIQASEFSKANNVEGYTWKAIEGLGYSNSSLSLFPFDHHVFNEETPSLEYHFEIKKAGNYEIEIRCLPTHSNNFDHQVWINTNGETSEAVFINTKGRSEAWKENVLRNCAVASFPVSYEEAGTQSLSVYVNQTGIVIDQISIRPEGYPEFYEVMKK